MLLLNLLHDQEDYGYNIVVRLSEAGFDGIAEGTVYPALLRLEKQGLLASQLRASDAGPARKYYQITDDGKQACAAAEQQWHQLTQTVHQIISAKGMSHEGSRSV